MFVPDGLQTDFIRCYDVIRHKCQSPDSSVHTHEKALGEKLGPLTAQYAHVQGKLQAVPTCNIAMIEGVLCAC